MTTMQAVAVSRYRDSQAADHVVVVQRTDEGWEILDESDGDSRLVDRLTDPADDRACAEALARDYAGQAVLPAWAKQ
jgi:hypothetical protein